MENDKLFNLVSNNFKSFYSRYIFRVVINLLDNCYTILIVQSLCADHY